MGWSKTNYTNFNVFVGLLLFLPSLVYGYFASADFSNYVNNLFFAVELSVTNYIKQNWKVKKTLYGEFIYDDIKGSCTVAKLCIVLYLVMYKCKYFEIAYYTFILVAEGGIWIAMVVQSGLAWCATCAKQTWKRL